MSALYSYEFDGPGEGGAFDNISCPNFKTQCAATTIENTAMGPMSVTVPGTFTYFDFRGPDAGK